MFESLTNVVMYTTLDWVYKKLSSQNVQATYT